MLKEFKKFAIKGNMLDMAIGIVIGAAFSTIVKSLVDDIIMPIVGSLIGNVDFSNLYINLSGGGYESLAVAREAGATTVNYGLFINALIAFLIVAWALFFVVKGINKLKAEEQAPEPTEKDCPKCFSKISIKATRCSNCTSEL
ncbi:MAG: large conductance mechanosensitive channel protein MscL [Parcubacteria group bacterium]